MLKLYEEFLEYDKLHEVILQLENRIKYWFSEEGTLGKDTNLVDIDSTVTNKYSYRSITAMFSNENYMYQCIFTVNSEDGDKCSITIKRYELDDQKLLDKITEKINIDDVKEDFIISKISEMEEKNDNPEKSKIEVEKEKIQSDDNVDVDDTADNPMEIGNEENNDDQFNLGGPGGDDDEYEF